MKRGQVSRDLDGPTLARVLSAGVRHLFSRRDYINRINVFPVPDSDTGTNMAFTFKAILDALDTPGKQSLPEVLDRVRHAAVDGARGNSGAIMAQWFQGCTEVAGERTGLDPATLAAACARGAEQAWSAMAEPVPGTLPSVLEAFSDGMVEAADLAQADIVRVFDAGVTAAQAALADTPNQLPVLRQAGVVDAGGQGFVDLLEGMQAFVADGTIDPLDDAWASAAESADPAMDHGLDVGDHQFCTECVIEGQGLDRAAIMTALQALDHSSLVVAGGDQRVRVHIHVNQPADVFLACEAFGEIRQQKADDMQWQHGLMNLAGGVAVVTDSGADLPVAEVERLGLHVVPVRLSFGDREYLDGVSLKPVDFYRMLETATERPKTSQPPAKDFRRVFELLTVHGYRVVHVGLSGKLSGTTRAASTAAEAMDPGQVTIFDTMNAACGQGLLALLAAEAAAAGKDVDAILAMLERVAHRARTMAMPNEVKSMVRGGRVPAWLGKMATWLRLTPIIADHDGKLTVVGVATGRRVKPASLARRALAAMKQDRVYRVMVSHADNREGARELRRLLLEGHPRIHSCHLAEAGPAVGVHLGRGGLIIGFMPEHRELEHET
ncbi:DegV family EDD domain-containing protein [Marinihelvus fidelis]|uniref:DegV family EDD domain-containing protein n=1 Tax=Marinihelvus fidelis TaxID=2613842 RepID=A0A5N0T9L4_9GAMM|nr:DegV family protein [Marinihelvus fidelis]KAA9130496.1 DegV family EDD domain-containing protein [Marinihelvus fidelis]